MALSAFETAPPELAQIAKEMYRAGVAEGLDDAAAADLSYKKANAAGWFVTSGEWQKIGPERSVSFRLGELQPDGNYLIRNIPVFYPNAVKPGADKAFTPEVISRMIENSNTSVRDGTAPGLSKGHPTQLDGPLGNPRHAFGQLMNVKVVDNQTYTDLFNVPPDVFQEWKDGKWIGLSAGIVGDAADTNLRIGHVALLGAESPALSRLSQTVVYTSPSYTCFSSTPITEPVMDTPQVNPATNPGTPAIDPKTKALETLNAAYAAHFAGEPGAIDKIRQGHAACMSAMGGGATPAPATPPAAGPKAGFAAATPGGVPSKGDPLSTAPKEPQYEGSEEVVSNETKFSAMFERAVNKMVAPLAAQLAAMKEEKRQEQANAALSNFSTECDSLINNGHQIDKASALVMFSALQSNPTGLAALTANLKAAPKKTDHLRSALQAGQTIFSEELDPKTGQVTDFSAQTFCATAGLQNVDPELAKQMLTYGSIAAKGK